MRCEVEYTDEFEAWWNRLSEVDQGAVNNAVNKLVLKGVALRGEHTKDVRSSRHGNMRELRVRTRPPIRVFYAFDPRRTAILLIGGHKTHAERFYRDYVPRADAIYDEYLREIRQEVGADTRSGPDGGRGTITMTGHHPWDELMRKHYTPEERERMLENARRELEEEEEERSQAPAGPASHGPQGRGSADERPGRNAPEGR